MKATIEMVQAAFEEAEEHKLKRVHHRSTFPADLRRIKRWDHREFPAETLGGLQMFVYPYESDGTLGIFRELGSARIKDVAINLPHLRRLKNPVVTKWLAPIDESLKANILHRRRPSLIFVNPAAITYGHIVDGNHTAITSYVLHLEGERPLIPAYVGRYGLYHWLKSIRYGLLKEGDIRGKERMLILKERMQNIFAAFHK